MLKLVVSENTDIKGYKAVVGTTRTPNCKLKPQTQTANRKPEPQTANSKQQTANPLSLPLCRMSLV